MEPLELGRDLVALLLQPRELLLALVPSLGEDGLQALDLGLRALVLLLQVRQILLVRRLCLGEGRLEPLEFGQQALLLASGLLRLGEGGFQALDLAAQLAHLGRVGLDRERRLRARLGLFGQVLGRGLKRFLGTGLGLFDFLDLHDLLGLGLRVCLDGLGLGRIRLGSVFARLGGRLCGGRDGRRRQPELREAATRLVRLGHFVLRRDAEREAVLGPERAAALHGERVRDGSA